MHATQPQRRLQPVRSASRSVSTPSRSIRSQHSSRHHRARAIESSAKLSVNCILAIAAGTALVKLLPYGFEQQAKLQQIHSEVVLVKERVDRLQTDFNRNFDPQQTKAIMQEQSSRVDPQQRQVIWVTPASATSSNSPEP